MTQQVINIGQSVNDKHGDPIRTAFAKVNNNFTDLYTQVSGLELDAVIPSQSTNGGKYLTTNGTTLSWDDIPQLKNGSATLSLNAQGILTLPSSSYLESTDTNLKVGAQGTVTIRSNAASNLTTKEWTFDTAGHLVPGSDILQDIGTPSNRVRHIYVGPGSISIGDSVLSESTTGKLVVPGLTRATALHADEVQDTVDQTYSFSNVPVVVDSYAYAIFAGMIAPDNSYISAIYNVDQLDSEGFIDGISIDQNATGTWTQAIADINRNNNMFAYIGSDIRESFNAANWIEIPFVVRAKANDVEYEFSTNGSGTGDIRFVSNAMYDLNGIIIENADLEHGSTASVLLPANGSTGEGSEILINNSYSDVAIGTGTNGTLTNFWRFGTDGALSIPPSGRITQPPFSIGPFSVVDGNSYQGYSELYINKSDVPNLDQLIHEGDTVADGNDSNNFVTITRPIGDNGSLWTITFTAGWPNGSPQTLSFRSIGGTWVLSTNGNFTAPGNIVVGSNPFNNGGNEQHFVIDASNYWTSIQWKNFTSPQDPANMPFECQAQLLRVFASENTVTAVCNVSNPREELVAVTAVRPNNTMHNGIMISTSDGKIPDAPYNDGQGTRHDWVFGGDGNLTTPQGGTNTTSSIGQGPDSDWINPNNNTWSIRTYNGGFSGTYTYGEAPLVWWDAANSPMGNSQFRGAVIEYHAYTNQGTVVGTIIISSDFNPVEYTHSEMISGGGQLATYKFWDINSYNRGQVALTTAGDNVNLMIMWTSRVFYGSEFNC